MIVAPLAAPGLCFLSIEMLGFYYAITRSPSGTVAHEIIEGLSIQFLLSITILPLFLTLSYVASLILGVPIFLALRFLRWTGRLPYVLLGLASSAFIFSRLEANRALLWEHDALASHFGWTPLGVIVDMYILFAGPITALVFWQFARPDRPHPSVQAQAW